MLKKVCFGLVVFGFAIQGMAAPLTMGQIYNYASKSKTDSLKKAGSLLDIIGKNGDTALCLSVKKKDYNAFYQLKQNGASTRHPCIGRISQKEILRFNAGYRKWIVSNKAIATSEEAGLSTGAKVGIGVGAAVLVGGGIALAVGGGGGGGSSPSCKAGYFMRDGNCEPNACTGYDLSACPTGGNCSECQSGEAVKYKFDSCQIGYTQNGESCTINPCTGYTLTRCPLNATGCSECQAGYEKKYKINGCKAGWNGDTCETPITCPYNTTVCGQGYHETGNTCQSGNRLYKECASNDCTGYDLSACPTGGNCSKCQSGEVEKYKLNSCQIGYTQNGDSCTANICNGSTSHVANCEAETTCTSPSGSYYTCTQCNTGYSLSGNECLPAQYNCPANTYGVDGVCSSCPANSIAPARSDSIDDCQCISGYIRIGNICVTQSASETTREIANTEFLNYSKFKNTATLSPINADEAYAKFIRYNPETGLLDYSALAPVKVIVEDTIGEKNYKGAPEIVHPAINYATTENGKRDYLDFYADGDAGPVNAFASASKTFLGTDTPYPFYHGLASSSTIAGKWNGSNDYWGVAPNASVYMVSMSNPYGINFYDTGIEKGVRVINQSYLEATHDTSKTSRYETGYTLDTALNNNTYQYYVRGLQNVAKNNVVIVKAAGNYYDKSGPVLTHATGSGAYTWTNDDGSTYNMKNLFITAVASTNGDTGNTLHAYSHYCGWAQGWCLTAPVGTKTASIKVESIGSVKISDITKYYVKEYTEGTQTYSGTSNAAPVISGSVAFLMGAYPYLKSQDIVEILFRTANKDVFAEGTWVDDGTWTDSFGNTYRTSKIYGHGMVDLGAATEPLGVMSLPTSTASATSMGDLNAISKAPLSETKLALPRVLNRSLSVALPETVMGLDDYNRPFAVKTGNLITQAHRTDESFRRHFKSFMNRTHRTLTGVPDKMSFEFSSSQTDDDLLGMGVLDINYRFNDTVGMKFSYRSDMIDEEKHFDRALANPFLNMTDSYGLTQEFNLNKNFTFKVGTILGKNGFYRGDEDLDEEYNRSVHAFTTEADYKINKALTLKVIGGMLSETDAALGINGTGALNTDTSKTYFTGSVIEYYPFEGLTLSASYYYGQTQVPNSESLVSFGDLISDGFALDARYQWDKNKMFGLQFSSPLRIRKGMATLHIPVARDLYSDTVYYDTVRVGLKPSAREYDIGLYYTQETENYDWRGELMTRFNPDHISGIKPDYRALFGLSLKY